VATATTVEGNVGEWVADKTAHSNLQRRLRPRRSIWTGRGIAPGTDARAVALAPSLPDLGGWLFGNGMETGDGNRRQKDRDVTVTPTLKKMSKRGR